MKSESSGLSPENASLAQHIVRAVLAATDHKIAEERKKHQAEVAALKQEIRELKDERDHDENYGRKNSIIISGSAIPKSLLNEDTYNVAASIVNSNTGISITRSDIDVCHRLPSRKAEDDQNKKSIIVKFVRREVKHRIIQAARQKKPKNVYFNDSLSRTRGKIRYVLAKAKKYQNGKISSIKTDDGNIKVFTPPLQSGGSFIRTTINTKAQLDDFLMTKFGYNSSRFLKPEDW